MTKRPRQERRPRQRPPAPPAVTGGAPGNGAPGSDNGAPGSDNGAPGRTRTCATGSGGRCSIR